MNQFHQGLLVEDRRYLLFAGISLWMWRLDGRMHVQMFVAYDILDDGTRRLLTFTRGTDKSQAA